MGMVWIHCGCGFIVMVSNEGWVWLVAHGRVIGDDGGELTPMPDVAGVAEEVVAGVAEEVWSFLHCGESGGVEMGSRVCGEVAVSLRFGGGLEGDRQCHVGWTFVGVVGTREQISWQIFCSWVSACLIHEFWWGTGGIGVPGWLCLSIPFVWVWASLVLDLHSVTYLYLG